jgi:hypothetical protein
MRVLLPVAFAASVAAVSLGLASSQGRDASPALAAARDALGGESALSAVKAFVATGRTRQVRGSNLVPIEFEIACELPSKYVRRDEVPAQESEPTTSGFNGDALILFPRPQEAPTTASRPAAQQAAPTASTPPSPQGSGSSGPRTSAADPGKVRVAALKQDFVKLTLGMFAASFEVCPLTFTLFGQAEAPQGTADVIDVKGPDGLALRFFVNTQTHLPIMVSWTTPATNVVLTDAGNPAPANVAPGTIVVEAPPRPAPGAPPDALARYASDVQALRRKVVADAKPLEHRLYYADYRDVGKGVRFPFRLRRATAGETVEETNFDGFKINPRIDPRKFDSVK